MLKFKKNLCLMFALLFAFSMLSGTTVFARDIDTKAETIAVGNKNARASSTVVGPDGNLYSYIGTATRNGAKNYPVDVLLRQTIKGSDRWHIAFYCPNNNRMDLIQGKVTVTPVLGGTVQTFSFLNYANEISNIDLSKLSGVGSYKINIRVDAIGTSNRGEVNYRLYK